MRRTFFGALLAVGVSVVGLMGNFPIISTYYQVKPWTFDPSYSHLVASGWGGGAGCPTNAKFDDVTYAPYYPPGQPPSPYTDPACPTGDASDKYIEGLGLIKTGPTYNNASSGATLEKVYGQNVYELGYDLRKPVDLLLPDVNDPRGSHCGAGAPRFNVVTKPSLAYPAGLFFAVGCNSPVATSATGAPGGGWIRLRWGNGTPGSVVAYAYDLFTNTWLPTAIPITDKVKSIDIVFDEGQDGYGGPDRFGVAILDNIDFNGKLVGRGPSSW